MPRRLPGTAPDACRGRSPIPADRVRLGRDAVRLDDDHRRGDPGGLPRPGAAGARRWRGALRDRAGPGGRHAHDRAGPAGWRHLDLSARYRHHYLAREEAIPLFAGAAELLRELDDAGYLLAVATGKSRSGLDAVLAGSGLAGRFHATRCASEGQPKPHPEMLLHLMDVLATDAADTLMIGDTTHDLELARNAGTAALAVSYGAHPVEGFAAYSPLATLRSIGDLRDWLVAHG